MVHQPGNQAQWYFCRKLLKMIKIITILKNAFDALYNFLDFLVRMCFVVFIIILQQIGYLFRPVIEAVRSRRMARLAKRLKSSKLVVLNHVKRIRRLDDEFY